MALCGALRGGAGREGRDPIPSFFFRVSPNLLCPYKERFQKGKAKEQPKGLRSAGLFTKRAFVCALYRDRSRAQPPLVWESALPSVPSHTGTLRSERFGSERRVAAVVRPVRVGTIHRVLLGDRA